MVALLYRVVSVGLISACLLTDMELVGISIVSDIMGESSYKQREYVVVVKTNAVHASLVQQMAHLQCDIRAMQVVVVCHSTRVPVIDGFDEL